MIPLARHALQIACVALIPLVWNAATALEPVWELGAEHPYVGPALPVRIYPTYEGCARAVDAQGRILHLLQVRVGMCWDQHTIATLDTCPRDAVLSPEANRWSPDGSFVLFFPSSLTGDCPTFHRVDANGRFQGQPLAVHDLSGFAFGNARAAVFRDINRPGILEAPDTLQLASLEALPELTLTKRWESTTLTSLKATAMNLRGDVAFVCCEWDLGRVSQGTALPPRRLILVPLDGAPSQLQLPERGELALAVAESGERVALYGATEAPEVRVFDTALRCERTVDLGRCAARGTIRGVDGLALDDRGHLAAGIRLDDGQLLLVFVGSDGECREAPVPDESFCQGYELHFFGENHLLVISCQTARVFRFE